MAQQHIDVADLYTRLGSMEGRLSEMSSKIDIVVAAQQARLDAIDNDVDRLKDGLVAARKDIAIIQKFRYMLTAVGTVGGAVLGTVITYAMPYARAILAP